MEDKATKGVTSGLRTREDETFKLRSYQDEMLQESLRRNVTVAMDTGSGKTHIAIARIRQELETCIAGKRVWFLAPTVALCQQHYNNFRVHLSAYQLLLLTGEDDTDRWTEQQLWDSVLTNVDVVVSSPDVLLDALGHGFVNIQSLTLLVFDEAHHCTKKHPMNRIMQNFYHPVDRAGGPVPHILGLSASPAVNAKAGGLQIVESNLNAVAITPKLCRLDLMAFTHVPELIRFSYLRSTQVVSNTTRYFLPALEHELRTYDLRKDPYFQELQSREDPDANSQLIKLWLKQKTDCKEQLETLYRSANILGSELGLVAADWYIKTCIDQYQYSLQNGGRSSLSELADREARHLSQILASVRQAAPDEISLQTVTAHLSAKASILIDILVSEASESFVGIIFVETRATVALLAQIISAHPKTTHLYRLGTFVGSNGPSKRQKNLAAIVEFKGQQQTLDDFRSGAKNLIIATNVLEEGIDVSACQAVICFDPPKNLVSFIQRRGRARKEKSKYILLLPEQDVNNKPEKWHDLEEKMKAAYMDDLREAERAKELESQIEADGRQYRVPSTGALLTLETAKSHLYHFCATLQSDGYTDLRPVFACTTGSDGLVSAEVILPSCVHPSLRKAKSLRAWKTERNAITDAAFEAYVMLHVARLLNDNLLPLTKSARPIPDAQVPQDRPSMVLCSSRRDPWIDMAACLTQNNTTWSRNHVTIVLNGESLPQVTMLLPGTCPPVSEFNLYWDSSAKGYARITKVTENLPPPTFQELDAARDITLTLLTSVFGARVDLTKTDFSALFVPTSTPNGIAEWAQRIRGTVPAKDVIKPGTTPSDLGLLRVQGQMGRGYVFRDVVTLSPNELDGASDGDGEDRTKDRQLIQAYKFSRQKDLLRPYNSTAVDKTPSLARFLTHECAFDNLPKAYAVFAAFIPAILHRVNVASGAAYLQQSLLADVGISNLDLTIEATTASSAAEPVNYQRLEYLGDAVLKFLTHVQLMAQHPVWPESYLTAEKGRTNGNASLASAALNAGLNRYILRQGFTAHKWRPPYLSTAELDADVKVELSSKVLADVVEALIGASFVEGGLSKALSCVRLFLPAEQWDDLSHSHNTLSSAIPTTDTFYAEHLEELIGYAFRNRALLREAVTHASFADSGGSAGLSYDRLEFLGDAVLDQVLVPFIFAHKRKLNQADMHRTRQALANAHFLAFCCLEASQERERFDLVTDEDAMTDACAPLRPRKTVSSTSLHDYLRCGPSLASLKHASLARYRNLRERVRNSLDHGTEYPWPDLFALQAPKFLSDMMESMLGAIYIDSQGSLDACTAFLERFGIMRYSRRFLDDAVKVAFPKERLGILAGTLKVDYQARRDKSDDAWSCAVRVGEETVVEVRGCGSRDEAEVRAASEAASIMEARQTAGRIL